jgi:cobalt-zinc-cadmium efflux system outer membrane protein
MARLRRDAGDASELDVQLATVVAGEAANGALSDSLDAISGALDLQFVMGLAADRVTIVLADTLALPPPEGAPAFVVGPRLTVAAAEADLVSAEQTLAMERRSVLAAPSLAFGFENHDPTGAETGVLPTFGVAIALPLFDRNRGGIALASAARDRAQATLDVARRESGAAVARAAREAEVARMRAVRDASLLVNAERLAAMALAAYAEGAASLPSVLEAQRNARDALGRYVDDVAAALTASHALRLLTATAVTP